MGKSGKKRIIIVLGMHRSGTSAITRGLLALGVDLGSNLLPPLKDDNEEGYWEDIDIVALNNEVLNLLGYDWHTLTPIREKEFERPDLDQLKIRGKELLRAKFKNKIVMGIKDPRISRLLPFWRNIFNQLDINAGYIIAVRNPLNVASSLSKRNSFELEKSSYLWLNHVVPGILYSEGNPRVVVDYDLLIEQPHIQLRRIAEAINLEYETSSSQIESYIKDFLRTELRHSKYNINDLNSYPQIPHDVIEVYIVMDKLARDEISLSSEELHDNFVRLNRHLELLRPAFQYMTKKEEETERYKQNIKEFKQKISLYEWQINNCENKISSILDSKSWRLTSPLRKVDEWILRVMHYFK